MHEKSETSCRGTGIFSLQVFFFILEEYGMVSPCWKGCLEGPTTAKQSLLLCTIVMPSLGCVEGWDVQCGSGWVFCVPAATYLLQVVKGS